jgi:hypothetical protein
VEAPARLAPSVGDRLYRSKCSLEIATVIAFDLQIKRDDGFSLAIRSKRWKGKPEDGPRPRCANERFCNAEIHRTKDQQQRLGAMPS